MVVLILILHWQRRAVVLDKKKRHVFIFKINNSIKEFDVNEMIYNKYDEQSFGILEYSGKNFIDFSEIKK